MPFIPIDEQTESSGFIPIEETQSPSIMELLGQLPGNISQRAVDTFGQMQRGYRQIESGITGMPGIQSAEDFIAGLIAGRRPEGTPRGDGLDAVANLVKGPANLLMGAMGMFPSNLVGGAVGETGWKALGQPGGELGRALSEIVGGVGAGLPELKLLSKLTSVAPRSALKTYKEAETAIAPASAIRAYEGTKGGVIPELEKVRKVSDAEQRLVVGYGNVERDPYTQVLREAVQDSIRKDRMVNPVGQKADMFLADVQTDEFRAFADQITKALRAEGYSDEAITAFIGRQAKMLYKTPEGVTPQMKVDRGVVSKEIEKLASTNPQLAEDIGVPLSKNYAPDLQEGLFGRVTEGAPGGIERYGSTTGDVYETGRQFEKVSPGQLTQSGYQQELMKDLKKSPILTEAEKTKKELDAFTDLMASRNPNYVPPKMATPDEQGHFMKFQNALIKGTGLLVTGPQTGLRNFLQQGTRTALEVPLQAYQEMLATGSLENAWQKSTSQLGALYDLGFMPRKMQTGIEETFGRLSEATQKTIAKKGMYEEYKNIRTPDWYEKTAGKAQKIFNWANEKQEKAFFYANYLASLEGDLKAIGKTLGKDITFGQLPQEMIDKAASHALEMTYSRNMPEAAQKAFEWALKVPGLGLLVNEMAPFARFNYGNALRDVINFSPIGFAQASLMKDPEKAARIMAKSMLGTKMIEQAARMKKDGQADIWEMDIPGLGRVDTRKWHPMDAYAFLGEIINRPIGSKNQRVTPEDYIALFSGGTRIEDTAMGVLAQAQNFSEGQVLQGFMQSLQQMVARWTTPLKWADAAYALGSGRPEAMVDRDVMSGKFYGLDRAMANVPGLRELLPERIDPTQQEAPGPTNRWDYALRMSGLEPVRQSALKEELKRLKVTGPQGKDFLNNLYDKLNVPQEQRSTISGSVSSGDLLRKMYGSTGDKELNREMNDLMRKVGAPIIETIMKSDVYQKQPDAVRRLLIDFITEDLRSELKDAAIAKLGPGKALGQIIKNMDPTLRGILDATR